MKPLSSADGEAFARCIAAGGVAVFPADTVYGLACAPDDAAAVARLYGLKGRPPTKPAAVLFFDRDRALATLDELGPRTRAALARLLPGAVTVLLPNPAGRFPLAGGLDATDPAASALGIRVPALTAALAALADVDLALLQSSANVAGGPDARRVADVPAAIRAGADLVLDAGPLPGTPSSVVDLRRYEDAGTWAIVREGAVPRAALAEALD
ncbi:MAG: SUA5/yciO/yrdC domain protein [Conexibacter sp.]|nr:SUA5/yciO/yrdC domain protein [Conexibacter sp.]